MSSPRYRHALFPVFVACLALVTTSSSPAPAATRKAVRTAKTTVKPAVTAAPTTAAPATTAAATSSTKPAPVVKYQGKITLDPKHAVAGTSVNVTGEGLPASTSFTLTWGTVDCRWVLQGVQKEEYHGRECIPRTEKIGSARTDTVGRLTGSFVVPDDYGFAHDLSVVDPAGVIVNKALFTVDMSYSVTPTRGPLGTPITIVIKGMGYVSLENTRAIVYDNAYTGWMSSVTTRGTAKAVIPATGAVGPHRILLDRGAFTFPYLNPVQSPRPDIPVFDAVFTVTDGDPVLPPAVSVQNPVARRAGELNAAGSAPVIGLDYEAGPVGTPVVLSARNMKAGDKVDLAWYRIVGTRVGASGGAFEEVSIPVGTGVVGSDGNLRLTFNIPSDVGGTHRIEAQVAGQKVAQTTFMITPSALPLASSTMKWGTPFEMRLLGVGWTETANIYTIVFDNVYLGYACGFNSQGDVRVPTFATGSPGWHFIDLYPAIYKGKETSGQDNFRIPQLTYTEDHPGEKLPAFHFAYKVEA